MSKHSKCPNNLHHSGLSLFTHFLVWDPCSNTLFSPKLEIVPGKDTLLFSITSFIVLNLTAELSEPTLSWSHGYNHCCHHWSYVTDYFSHYLPSHLSMFIQDQGYSEYPHSVRANRKSVRIRFIKQRIAVVFVSSSGRKVTSKSTCQV